MNDYKLRATKVLHEKDSLISQLSASLNSAESSTVTVNPSTPSKVQPSIGIVKISSIEYNNMIHERESLAKEIEEYKEQLSKLEQSLGESQVEFTNERTRLLNQLKELEEAVEREKKKYQAMQMQNVNISNELMACKEDYEKQLADFLISLKSKDDELSKLKKQSVRSSLSPNSQSITPSVQEELENRIKSITENLIQKQNQLESLLSEKAYLQLQIENLMQQVCLFLETH